MITLFPVSLLQDQSAAEHDTYCALSWVAVALWPAPPPKAETSSTTCGIILCTIYIWKFIAAMFDWCRNAERPECWPTGLTTTSRCQVMVIAVWLGSALRPRPTARPYCDVCLLFITAPSSLFPRHLIRPDTPQHPICHGVIAIYPTAESDSCIWRRRDEEVRKTFAFL